MDGSYIHIHYSNRSNLRCHIVVLDYEKEDLLNEINLGAKKKQGIYGIIWAKYLYVPFAAILCLVALFMKDHFKFNKIIIKLLKTCGGSSTPPLYYNILLMF